MFSKNGYTILAEINVSRQSYKLVSITLLAPDAIPVIALGRHICTVKSKWPPFSRGNDWRLYVASKLYIDSNNQNRCVR